MKGVKKVISILVRIISENEVAYASKGKRNLIILLARWVYSRPHSLWQMPTLPKLI
jgi:hypothetical protein